MVPTTGDWACVNGSSSILLVHFLGHPVECFPNSNFALILPWSFIILFNQIFGQQSCTMIISCVGFWENTAWDITAWDHTANTSYREKTENKRSQHHLSFTKGPEKDWQAGKITCCTSLNIKVMTVPLLNSRRLQPDKTSQELRMLSRSPSDCRSLLLNLNLSLNRCLCSDCSAIVVLL